MQSTRQLEWVGDVGMRTISCSADQNESGPRCFLPVTIVDQQEHSECAGQLKKGGSAMQFSVGDKVVHPQYGPGQIADVVWQELMDGAKCYYVIDIPSQGLTLRAPALRTEELGMRPAMPLSLLPQVLSTLRSKPCRLPDDATERQGQIDVDIKTGEVLPLARVVRDLTWHRQQHPLTKRDSDVLKLGQARLAAEMALVSGDKAADSIKLIGSTMTAALASASG